MTEATETLDTLIDIAENVPSRGSWDDDAELIHRLAKALTDLRTERDGLAAVIDKARIETGELTRQGYPTGILVRILATAPTSALADRDAAPIARSAHEYTPTTQRVREVYMHNHISSSEGQAEFDRWLADRDARILEEAADAWHAQHAGTLPGTYRWLWARAASVRAGADNPASHDSQSGADRG